MADSADPMRDLRRAVQQGRMALRELDSALAAVEKAAAQVTATEGRSMISTVSTWQKVRQVPRAQYQWPEKHGGLEIYEPLDIFESAAGLQLGIGYNTQPVRVWDSDHRHIWIFRPASNGVLPGDPIATFLSTDDYEESGEYVAYIKGKGTTGKQNFGPGDALPPEYDGMDIQIHRDRIAKSYIKYCVVAHKDDPDAMLNHAAAQIAIRGL